MLPLLGAKEEGGGGAACLLVGTGLCKQELDGVARGVPWG